MIHALLPIYLVTVLGASALTVGFIEEIAEATAAITKIFSGVLFDWLGKRKLLAVIGYGLAALTKPIFPLATGVDQLVAARFIDASGREFEERERRPCGGPCPRRLRGASFGLRQSLDTVGAFVGPLLAIGLMLLTSDSFKAVFWIAVIPAFIACGLLLVGVEEPVRPVDDKGTPALRLADAKRFPALYWAVVGVATVLTLARFSEAFLVLRSQDAGTPGFIRADHHGRDEFLGYALAAYPAGVVSDRLGRFGVLSLGVAFLIVADLLLGLGASIPLVLLGVAFWGLHMGFTQGLAREKISPREWRSEFRRGTQFRLDLQEAIVFGDALAAAGRAGLDLPAAHRHGEIGHEGVFGFAGAMGDDVSPSRLAAELDRLNRLADGPNLIELDQHGVGGLLGDAATDEVRGSSRKYRRRRFGCGCPARRSAWQSPTSHSR